MTNITGFLIILRINSGQITIDERNSEKQGRAGQGGGEEGGIWKISGSLSISAPGSLGPTSYPNRSGTMVMTPLLLPDRDESNL